jgi:hypothetical protein
MSVSVCNAESRTQFTQNPCHASYDGQSMRYSGRIFLKNVIYTTEIARLFSGRREKGPQAAFRFAPRCYSRTRAAELRKSIQCRLDGDGETNSLSAP